MNYHPASAFLNFPLPLIIYPVVILSACICVHIISLVSWLQTSCLAALACLSLFVLLSTWLPEWISSSLALGVRVTCWSSQGPITELIHHVVIRRKSLCFLWRPSLDPAEAAFKKKKKNTNPTPRDQCGKGGAYMGHQQITGNLNTSSCEQVPKCVCVFC